MKLIHLSDLHLGKRVHECSMLEDQEYILKEILQKIDRERPDGVLIAGTSMISPSRPPRRCPFWTIFWFACRNGRCRFFSSAETMTLPSAWPSAAG